MYRFVDLTKVGSNVEWWVFEECMLIYDMDIYIDDE